MKKLKSDMEVIIRVVKRSIATSFSKAFVSVAQFTTSLQLISTNRLARNHLGNDGANTRSDSTVIEVKRCNNGKLAAECLYGLIKETQEAHSNEAKSKTTGK
jgi:hypothetical protein